MSNTTATRRDVTTFAAILAGEMSFVVPAATNGAGQIIAHAFLGTVVAYGHEEATGRYWVETNGQSNGQPAGGTTIFADGEALQAWADEIIRL